MERVSNMDKSVSRVDIYGLKIGHLSGFVMEKLTLFVPHVKVATNNALVF